MEGQLKDSNINFNTVFCSGFGGRGNGSCWSVTESC